MIMITTSEMRRFARFMLNLTAEDLHEIINGTNLEQHSTDYKACYFSKYGFLLNANPIRIINMLDQDELSKFIYEFNAQKDKNT